MRIVTSLAAGLAVCALVWAQDAAPRETVSATVGEGEVSVEHGRPSLNGRTFDELVEKLPEDRMWRAGSEQVTTIEATTAVLIGGQEVPAGKYSLYVHCPKEGSYSLAINRVLGQPLSKIWEEAPPDLADEPWPHFDYTNQIGDEEVARVKMEKVETTGNVEQFTVTLEESGEGAIMKLAWGDRAWSVDLRPSGQPAS